MSNSEVLKFLSANTISVLGFNLKGSHKRRGKKVGKNLKKNEKRKKRNKIHSYIRSEYISNLL